LIWEFTAKTKYNNSTRDHQKKSRLKLIHFYQALDCKSLLIKDNFLIITIEYSLETFI